MGSGLDVVHVPPRAPSRSARRARATGTSLFAVALLAAGCGSEPPVVIDPGDGALYPLEVGNRWTFRITDSSGGVSTKTQEITGTTMTSGGVMAYVTLTRRAEDKGTRSVQGYDGERMVRYSEQTLMGDSVIFDYRFEPPALRIHSGEREVGATYSDTHDKLKLDVNGDVLEVEPKTHTFTVEAVETIQVPAGDFECVRIARSSSAGTDKVYWYAPGVGKVKEIGGQTEELESVEIVRPSAEP